MRTRGELYLVLAELAQRQAEVMAELAALEGATMGESPKPAPEQTTIPGSGPKTILDGARVPVSVGKLDPGAIPPPKAPPAEQVVAYFGRDAYSVALDAGGGIVLTALDSRPRMAYCVGCRRWTSARRMPR